MSRISYLPRIISLLVQFICSEVRKINVRVTNPGVVFGGRVYLSPGCSITVARGGRLELTGCRVGRGVTITVARSAYMSISAETIGNYSTLVAREAVLVGPGSKIAEMVVVRDGNHDHSVPLSWQRYTSDPVSIGCDVWLAAGVKVLAGVTIGDSVTVGAGAVVNKDLPAGCTAVGVPARVVS